MSLEGFQIIDNKIIDISKMKRDVLKIYHQQGANWDNSDQNIDFIRPMLTCALVVLQ